MKSSWEWYRVSFAYNRSRCFFALNQKLKIVIMWDEL